jgi:hypothetical protein
MYIQGNIQDEIEKRVFCYSYSQSLKFYNYYSHPKVKIPQEDFPQNLHGARPDMFYPFSGETEKGIFQ